MKSMQRCKPFERVVALVLLEGIFGAEHYIHSFYCLRKLTYQLWKPQLIIENWLETTELLGWNIIWIAVASQKISEDGMAAQKERDREGKP